MNKTITKIEILPKLQKKISVAAYARVSSGKDAMLHSLSQQVSYYNRMIQQHDEWNFAGVYSDEAITGTKDNRLGFQRMLEDCRSGKIDMIITKSISRFARNTLTLLETVREFTSCKVDVYFEEQDIHTLSGDGELILTFLGSFAQEESRSVSENMKWRIKKDFEEGLIWGSKSCMGYKLQNRKLILVPQEANLVREIFELYIGGAGEQKICNILNKNNIPSYHGCKWGRFAVRSILTNYNYTGDLLLQKTYRVDHLSKITRDNLGEYPKYIVEDDHEPIISKEIFNKVIDLREQRKHKSGSNKKSCNTYDFSGYLKCSSCGKSYRHKINYKKAVWVCDTFNRVGKSACQAKQIPEAELYVAINELLGFNKFNPEKFKALIDHIDVMPENTLNVYYKNGNVKTITWEYHSRKETWTPELRDLARQNSIRVNLERNKQWQK